MGKLIIERIASAQDRSLPVFAEFDAIADRVRRRAYDLFAGRGFDGNRDLDDWLTAERQICWPDTELSEDEKGYHLRVALAGFEPEDITVTATPRELIVKAVNERRESSNGNKVLRWTEFRSDDVYRRVEFPDPVNADRLSAKLKRGILEIDAPKAKATAGKKKKQKSSAKKAAARAGS